MSGFYLSSHRALCGRCGDVRAQVFCVSDSPHVEESRCSRCACVLTTNGQRVEPVTACDECGEDDATVVLTVGRFCSIGCLDKYEADRAVVVPADLKGVA